MAARERFDFTHSGVAQEAQTLRADPALDEAELAIVAHALEAHHQVVLGLGEARPVRDVQFRTDRQFEDFAAFHGHPEPRGPEFERHLGERLDELETAGLGPLAEGLTMVIPDAFAFAVAVGDREALLAGILDRHFPDRAVGQEPAFDDDLVAERARPIVTDTIRFQGADDVGKDHLTVRSIEAPFTRSRQTT